MPFYIKPPSNIQPVTQSSLKKARKSLEIFLRLAQRPGVSEFKRFKDSRGPVSIADFEDESLWEPSTKEESLKRVKRSLEELEALSADYE